MFVQLYEFVNYGQKCILWGHSNLDLWHLATKFSSNQFILELLLTSVPNLKTFRQCVSQIRVSFTKLDNSNALSLQPQLLVTWRHKYCSSTSEHDEMTPPVICRVLAPTFSIGSMCWLLETVGAFDNANPKIISITEMSCTDCLVETRLISILTTPSYLFCVFLFFPVRPVFLTYQIN